MPVLTEDDVSQFGIRGAIRVKRVLPPQAVQNLRGLAEQLMSLPGDVIHIGGPTVYVNREGTGFCEFVSRHYRDIRDWVSFQELADIARRVSRSAEVFFWRDELYSKRPGDAGNATPWHHAIGSLPFKGSKITVIWIPLVDIDADSAPLRTIDGSNNVNIGRFRPPIGRENVPLLDGYSEIPDFDHLIKEGYETATVWTAEAGDAIVFGSYTVHGSMPNSSSSIRHAYVTRWLGDDVRWSPDEYSVVDLTIHPGMLNNGRPTSPHFERFA